MFSFILVGKESDNETIFKAAFKQNKEQTTLCVRNFTVYANNKMIFLWRRRMLLVYTVIHTTSTTK